MVEFISIMSTDLPKNINDLPIFNCSIGLNISNITINNVDYPDSTLKNLIDSIIKKCYFCNDTLNTNVYLIQSLLKHDNGKLNNYLIRIFHNYRTISQYYNSYKYNGYVIHRTIFDNPNDTSLDYKKLYQIIFYNNMANVIQLVIFSGLKSEILLETLLIIYYLIDKLSKITDKNVLSLIEYIICENIFEDKTLDYTIPCFKLDYNNLIDRFGMNKISFDDYIIDRYKSNEYSQNDTENKNKIILLCNKIDKLETEISVYKELINKLIVKISKIEEKNDIIAELKQLLNK